MVAKDSLPEKTGRLPKEEAKRAFVENIAKLMTDTRAAQLSGGYGLHTFRGWQEEDVDFAREVYWAKQNKIDEAEETIIQRAFHGIQVPIISKGEIVGYRIEYSDRLAEFLLKAWNPAKYRDSYQVVQGESPPPLSGKKLASLRKGDVQKDGLANVAKDAREHAELEEQRMRDNT